MGTVYFQCRRSILPSFLHFRRHPYRGLWLLQSASRNMGGLLRTRLFCRNGERCRCSTPGADLAKSRGLQIAFGNLWRIVVASIVAYFFGEFANSYVLARMKVVSAGRYMGLRFVGSTFASEAVDSALFYPLAFYNSGLIPNDLVLTLMVSQFGLKTLVEIIMLPVTYRLVAFLKRAEQEDFYDIATNFNPFKL